MINFKMKDNIKSLTLLEKWLKKHSAYVIQVLRSKKK